MQDIVQTGIMVKEKTTEDETDVEEEFPTDLHGVERLVAFTDAVVAIAMTLLILPLMEAASELDHEKTSSEFFGDREHQFGAFLLSFYMIALTWRSHYKIFQYVESVTPAVLSCTFAWMLGITFFPVGSSLLYSAPVDDNLKFLFFAAPILFSLCASLVCTLLIQRERRTWKGSKGPGNFYVVGHIVLLFLLGIALLIAWLIPNHEAALYVFFAPLTNPFFVKLLERCFPNLMSRHIQ